jgi:Cd2+/Zn2+-exporting ATPase
MQGEIVNRLGELGFSEYEAKVYLALLRDSPATGYQVSKISGVPRSMVYEVLSKLTARGAAMELRKGNKKQYAPTSPDVLLDQLAKEHKRVVSSLREDLADVGQTSDLEYVWNIDGYENVMTRAKEMIGQAEQSVYLAVLPTTFPPLRKALEAAIERGIRVVVYSSGALDLSGGRVVMASMSEEYLKDTKGLGLILVVDGEEVLVGEQLDTAQARSSWTRSPLFVLIAEHHLRTDLYLPQILDLLGSQAELIIHEEDRDLFAQALERCID